ncbi:PBP1A family penicillin-binding protein [Acuticoccus sp. M5D2P5]|uniref:transglycosylase domain-containing protein n=1 Tax=Acuticoccus kalidii TaxID=2910977 RepID=UPI001F229FBD|nr:PBP1A family penicillin-binding protein [Acuticoccus kalidii]MCF3936135.1 PBP1A family penicillin-binding protein [Acuticoccus kalidii]
MAPTKRESGRLDMSPDRNGRSRREPSLNAPSREARDPAPQRTARPKQTERPAEEPRPRTTRPRAAAPEAETVKRAPRKAPAEGRTQAEPRAKAPSQSTGKAPSRSASPRSDTAGAERAAPRKRAPEGTRATASTSRGSGGGKGGGGGSRSGGNGRRPKRASGAARPRRRFSFFRFAFRMGVTLSLLGLVAVGAVIAYFAATLPPRAEWAVPERPPNVAILSEGGDLIANRGDTGGRAVHLADLPPYVPQAVIAIEDRRFYSHPGVDPIGLTRAMVTNLTSGRLQQGGSTLTQQLAKNLFLDPSRTLERKIQEMIFSVWLEMQYDKDEILEMYLNRVYLGAGATGIDGAARRYFSKGAEELTLPEAALIAGLLKAPSYYAPTNNLTRANARASTVLNSMQEAGFITAEEATYARDNPATLRAPDVATSGGYVADWVAEVLPEFVGSLTEDIIVETTVNLELQDLAQDALQDMLEKEGEAKNVHQGAVVVLDGGGAVKALVGGRQYGDSQYNRAVAAARQPGSSFKPFVYLAALEHGLTPQTMRIDQPTQIGNWSPQNYSRNYKGPVSLTYALSHSLNTIAAQLTNEVGPQAVAAVAERLGIRSPLEANASIALGTSEVTLLELTTAYVPFSNGGVGVVPHIVRRIKTLDGQLLYQRPGGGAQQVASLQDMGQMNAMLSQVITSGTGQRAQFGWPAAGKTGTSQNWRDAWFVGYTAFFTAGVWLGNDDNSPTKKVTGGNLPAELWKQLMTKVHEGMMPADLPGLEAIPAPLESSDEMPVDEPWVVQDGNQQMVQSPPVASARDGRDWIRPAPARSNEGFFRRLFGG